MLSVPHLIIIFIVALAVLGPEKLPQVARTLGKAMADFRRITGDFRYQIENEMREMDRQARLKELEQQNQNRIASPPGTIPQSTTPEQAPASADPQNPYVQAEESAYTASLNLSSPYAAGSEPNTTGSKPAAESDKIAAPPQNPDLAEPPAELASADAQKLGNGHS